MIIFRLWSFVVISVEISDRYEEKKEVQHRAGYQQPVQQPNSLRLNSISFAEWISDANSPGWLVQH